jgi:tetraacyldisaccharide 4'-kinase
MRKQLHNVIEKMWYGRHPLRWLLIPFSLIYSVFTRLRRWYLQNYYQLKSPIAVIVVGNITVGGVGKTPLVIALVKKLQEKGLKVGIVSRGYKAKTKHFPHEVQLNDFAEWVGDEPLMMARKTNCPVVIAPKRAEAVNYLLKNHQVQIVISDDGLQHYRMGRALEIAVIDGVRGLGNEYCLPAGPLREPSDRLNQVDFIVINQGVHDETAGVKSRLGLSPTYSMKMTPGKFVHLATEMEVEKDFFIEKVAAVAAIGNPQRFYSTLGQLGLEFQSYSYPDHYQLKPQDLHYSESLIIMTEKDAVKCRNLNSDKLYYLPVEAKVDEAFWDALWSHKQLKGFC